MEINHYVLQNPDGRFAIISSALDHTGTREYLSYTDYIDYASTFQQHEIVRLLKKYQELSARPCKSKIIRVLTDDEYSQEVQDGFYVSVDCPVMGKGYMVAFADSKARIELLMQTCPIKLDKVYNCIGDIPKEQRKCLGTMLG